MSHRLLLLTVFAATLPAACMSPMNSMSRLDLWGDPAPVTAAGRTIFITPETKYVNVAGGETVKFVVGDESFAWTFDGPSEGYKFDLNETAPPGVLGRRVIAYVDPNPLYMGR